MSYLKRVLENKIPGSSEIEIHLFGFCNLRCSFCSSNVTSKEGFDTILDKFDQIKSFIDHSDREEHTVNIMSGEPINDEVPEYVVDNIFLLMEKIHEYGKNVNKRINVNLVTNLLITKYRERLRQELDQKPYLNISTSYDFAGRGIDLNYQMRFKSNIEYFKDRIGVIGFVLTRPSIKKMLRGGDRFFDYLYQNFTLYFDWYVPEKSVEKMMPSEEEMLEALNYLADYYPNVEPVKSMLENEENKLTCFSLNKVTILPDGKEVTCRYLEYKDDDFINEVNYDSNENIIESHLERNGCLSCQYYNRCQMRCFVQADWKKLKRMDDCFIYHFFKRNTT